jgi:hypothetical protein
MDTSTPMKITTFLCLAGLTFSATLDAARAEDRPDYRPFTVTGEAGTTGAGGSFAWRFADHVGVRAGMDYFTYSRNDTIEGIPYSTDARLQSEVLTLNYYPWKKHSFFISLGALFNQNRLTGTSSDLNQPLTISGTTFPQGTVGTVHLRIEQQPVDPYLSFGGNLFYFDHAHHWSLGGELGVFYTGKPKVSLNRTGGVGDAAIDLALQQQKSRVQHYANRYQFWPVLKLAVNYSF